MNIFKAKNNFLAIIRGRLYRGLKSDVFRNHGARAQMKEDSLLSILVPISRRSDKNSGGANQKCIIGVGLLVATRH